MNKINTQEGSLYFILPNNHSLACIKRATTSPLTTTIASTLFPGISSEPGTHISTVIPLSNEPVGAVHAVIRNPIDRFKSVYARKFIPNQEATVDETISFLQTTEKNSLSLFLRPQSVLIGLSANVNFYDYSKGFNEVATALELPTPITLQEDTESTLPELTQDQIDKLNEIYADDVALYSSISAS